jgi:hypothetical protein
MAKEEKKSKKNQSPFERFRSLAQRVIVVPKMKKKPTGTAKN